MFRPVPTLLSNERRLLEAHLLGLVDFDSALALQERLAFEIEGSSTPSGVLLICEHPPIVTVGRDGRLGPDGETCRFLESRLGGVSQVSRGGTAVFHIPGQLAVYPLLPLRRLNLGVREFRQRLELALIDVCRELRVAAKRREEDPGIWTRQGQVAMFGAAVRRDVTMHGAYLNVTNDLSMLPSASFSVERATTLQSLLLRPVSMSQVREAVVRRFAERFGYHEVHVSVGHPSLRRTIRRICFNA